MEILINTTCAEIKLREADDLNRLSVIVEGSGSLQHVLKHVGREDTDGQHVWLKIKWIEDAASSEKSEEWLTRFRKMIDFAASKGWTDTHCSEVRLHIKR